MKRGGKLKRKAVNNAGNRRKTNCTKDLRSLASTKTGSSYQTSPASKKALDTDQENSNVSEVTRSSDHQARACGHERRGKQTSILMTGHLQTTSTSDKSNDKRSSTDDNLIQYADEVTQNPLFIPFTKYTSRSPEGQRKKSKTTKARQNNKRENVYVKRQKAKKSPREALLLPT